MLLRALGKKGNYFLGSSYIDLFHNGRHNKYSLCACQSSLLFLHMLARPGRLI